MEPKSSMSLPIVINDLSHPIRYDRFGNPIILRKYMNQDHSPNVIDEAESSLIQHSTKVVDEKGEVNNLNGRHMVTFSD